MSKLSLAGEWKLRGEFMDVTADRCAEVLVHLNAMPPKPTIPGYLTEENMTEEEREIYGKYRPRHAPLSFQNGIYSYDCTRRRYNRPDR